MIIDGKRLETAWWGPGPDEAPTLVLLHEGLGCVVRRARASRLRAAKVAVSAWLWKTRGEKRRCM